MHYTQRIPEDAMRRAMVVDDDKIIRGFVASMIIPLLPKGSEVMQAHSGERAMELLRQAPAAYLITDMRMGKMDGLELIRQAKQAWPWIQVIALSNYDDFDYVKPSFLYGIVDYMLKMQLTPQEFAVKIANANANLNEWNAICDREESDIRSERMERCLSLGILYESGMRKQTLPDFLTFTRSEPMYVLLRADAMPKNAMPNSAREWKQALSYRWLNIVSPLDTPANTFHSTAFLLPAQADAPRVRFGAIIALSARNQSNRGLLLSETIECMRTAASEANCTARVVWRESPISLDACSVLEAQCDLLFYQEGDMLPDNASPQAHPLILDELYNAFADALAHSDRERAVAVLRSAASRLRANMPSSRECIRSFERFRDVLERITGNSVRDFDDPENRYYISRMIRTLEDAVERKWRNGSNCASVVDPNVKALMFRVEENPAQSISLQEAASCVGFSVPHFCRVFKAAAGCTWGKYITRIRMEKAKVLLQLPGARVSNAAAAVGIDDASYFRKVFLRYTGSKPEDFIPGRKRSVK
ncbi:MAG: response regulator [Oscillospiraceae bacterium]|jgi:two-component system response regulator YesN|nr:response regulator [Oscillospiraceae bacterium]